MTAVLVEAIRTAATTADKRARFVSDALAAKAEMLESGKGLNATDVHAYLRTRAQGKSASKPKARAWRA